MPLDRQSIERRDFPISRRGYDPATVDVHLRALADEVEQLQRARQAGEEAPLAAAAGTRVQSILAAAETAAAEIERQAAEDARRTREEADGDALRTREQAIAQARAHVAAVAQATAALLERVGAMDGEASALVASLTAGATRLAADLAALETSMGELYDSASGRGGGAPATAPTPIPLPSPAPVAPPGPQAAAPSSQPPLSPPETAAAGVHPDPEAPPAPRQAPAGPTAPGARDSSTAGNGDLDGARLIALNMALNGESRADVDRYLAEHYQLADRQQLIDEVYAAIEG